MDRVERGKQLTERVDAFVAELEEQLAQGHTEEFIKLLEFYSQFRQYSLGNIMLILSQLPTATQCAGYKTWEKLGYQVRRGEEALWIRGPMLKKLPDLDTGEIVEQLIGWLALPVFDVSQLEGDVTIPQARHALEGDYQAMYQHAWQAVLRTGVELREAPLPGAKGVSAKGKIIIDPDQSPAEKCLALWHEMAHQLLEHHNRHGETTKEERELVSESVSFVVARIMGLDNPFSRDYILGFRGTTERLHDQLSEIHLATKRIMDLLWVEEMKEEEEPVAMAAD